LRHLATWQAPVSRSLIAAIGVGLAGGRQSPPKTVRLGDRDELTVVVASPYQ
jgi:hypothetical protein